MPSPPDFYKKPFRFKRIFDNANLDTCNAGVSISQHIELIIFTRFGEHRFNTSYGCKVWELDFELIVSATLWEEQMRQSLLNAITAHEPRLYETDVTVQVTDVEKLFPFSKMMEIKKRVSVTVNARLTDTGERYFFNTSLFLSPLSSE
ncbi:GPW/gp25 family protein [Deminuibacter soli]|uniref:IraD/Gp25-like domain-containing protein n=1 Tax=Deminuibacter soli TaxID=2291815 RepID=A0A3E1NCN2_9BACT|nr:GPW/gp25 family protein [Deminuibacter soli]RFM25601.1 hypothetical protein DXN05_24295 [Deminuibacter soli]